MTQKRRFTAGTYRHDYWVLVDDQPERAVKHIRRILDEADIPPPGGLGACYAKGSCPAIVWVRFKPTTPFRLATLNHELLHLTFEILDWASVKYSRDSEEAFTHLLGHITSSVTGWLKVRT